MRRPGRKGLSARCAAGGGRSGIARRPVRRRPGRDHDLLRTRSGPRLPIVVGSAFVHRRPCALSRPRSTHGCGHRAGPHRPGTTAVRRAVGRCRAGRAPGRQRRHDLCRVRRDRRRRRTFRDQSLRECPRRGGHRFPTGTAWQLSSCRAFPAAAVDGLPRLHRIRCAGAPGLGSRGPRNAGAQPANQQRDHRYRHRHHRHHTRPVGALVHPVLRRRQEAPHRGPLARAGGRGHGRPAHRHYWLLRGGGMCGDAASRRPYHPRRCRRCRRAGTPCRPSGFDTLRRGPDRGGVPCCFRASTLDGLLGMRVCRRRSSRRRLILRRPPLLPDVRIRHTRRRAHRPDSEYPVGDDPRGHPGAQRGAAGAPAVRDDRHRAGPRPHGPLHHWPSQYHRLPRSPPASWCCAWPHWRSPHSQADVEPFRQSPSPECFNGGGQRHEDSLVANLRQQAARLQCVT